MSPISHLASRELQTSDILRYPESLASQNYSLRSRAHNRQLPEHSNHLDDSNFIIRMLYKNMY